jgi:hypothetical protein
MKKEFNITGKCIPNLHYMADVSGKFGEILDMINRGRYFIINRPRQYGKTTALNQLADRLNMMNTLLYVLVLKGLAIVVFKMKQVFVIYSLNY